MRTGWFYHQQKACYKVAVAVAVAVGCILKTATAPATATQKDDRNHTIRSR